MHAQKVLFFGALLLALAGCSTIDSRIHEKPEVFNRLTPQTQADIRQGIVKTTYTPDMVYMVLGKPDKVQTEGSQTTWVYIMSESDVEGTQSVTTTSYDYKNGKMHEKDATQNEPIIDVLERDYLLTFAGGMLTKIRIVVAGETFATDIIEQQYNLLSGKRFVP
jgi:outer membrane protein assembly factor BamE (lipoprotein component of BamABCDE complex)